jgi:hypothetical protein
MDADLIAINRDGTILYHVGGQWVDGNGEPAQPDDPDQAKPPPPPPPPRPIHIDYGQSEAGPCGGCP